LLAAHTHKLASFGQIRGSGHGSRSSFINAASGRLETAKRRGKIANTRY